MYNGSLEVHIKCLLNVNLTMKIDYLTEFSSIFGYYTLMTFYN